jgi:hypothetical protein
MSFTDFPEGESPVVIEAIELIRNPDRSDTALERLRAIADNATPADKPKIGQLIEAFIAST